MKISIAIATYNGEKHLKEQLGSFVKQTRLPDELIVSDDLSSDNTFEIIKKFAEEAPFKVIYSQNKKTLGYAGNFSKALTKTSGDLILLSDQDDVWFNNKIETIEKVANECDELLIVNDKLITDANLKSYPHSKLYLQVQKNLKRMYSIVLQYVTRTINQFNRILVLHAK